MINIKMQCVPDPRLLEIVEQRYGDEEGRLPTKEIRQITQVDGTMSRELFRVGKKILVIFAPSKHLEVTNQDPVAKHYRDNREIMEGSQNIPWQAHYVAGDCLMDIYEYNK